MLVLDKSEVTIIEIQIPSVKFSNDIMLLFFTAFQSSELINILGNIQLLPIVFGTYLIHKNVWFFMIIRSHRQQSPISRDSNKTKNRQLIANEQEFLDISMDSNQSMITLTNVINQ